MTLLLLLMVLLLGYLAALAGELRRDGYGTRPGPCSHPQHADGAWWRP